MSAPISLTTQLLTVSILSLQRQMYHNRGMNRTTANPSYDFVVVGGGSAGCIVATRLSENPNVSVLLLEAGGPLKVTSDMIPLFYYLNYDWGYHTTSQLYSGFGFNNRQIIYPRGKIIGGSNAINNALYTRGNRREFDSWSNYYGAPGWTYNEVFPFFLKSENNTDPNIVAANPRYHSTSGVVEVSTPNDIDPIVSRWVNASHDLGWPANDINGPDQFGSSVLQATQSIQNRTRQSTGAAYLEVNIARNNLHVLTNSLVTRILFDSSTGTPTAFGVQFVRQNKTYKVNATREVIISGGAINSPQLLMLSGVGPRYHLQQNNIPVIADLPVGNNFYDHLLVPMDFLVTNESDIGLTSGIYHMLTVTNLYNFLVNHNGPLSRLPMSETYVPTGINGNRDWPDGLTYCGVNQYPDLNTVLTLVDQSNQDAWRKYFQPIADNNRHVFVAFSLFRPTSSGTIRLSSNNPFDHPLINTNYFSNQQDLAATVRTMSVGLKIAEYLSDYLTYTPVPVPGCKLCNDRPMSACYTYLACVAQTVTFTTFHPCCTCRMGNSSNPKAVVDERLRVMNVQKLRVIDASVMPIVPNANINAATMMIGEHGTHMILQDNNLI